MAYVTQYPRHRSTTPKRKDTRLLKLLICTVIFFVAVLLKISEVPGISEMVLAQINRESAQEVFQKMGVGVIELQNTVTEAFGSMIQEVMGSTVETKQESTVEVIDQQPDLPQIEPYEQPVATTASTTVNTALEEEPIEFTLPAEDTDDTTDPSGFTIPPPDIVSEEAVSIAFAYTTPVFGYVTSPFGYRDHPLDGETKFHYGIDIGAAEGTKILAFADGTVESVLQGEINGNYLKIAHADEIVSMYAHCQKIIVKAGQQVKKGEVIGYVGQTGQVSGPHLHFQLYKDGSIIDPTGYLEVST